MSQSSSQPLGPGAVSGSRGLVARVTGRIGRLRGREDLRQAGLVTGGTILAQVVTLGTTPILSRMYGPQEFALLGLLMNIATTGGSIGGLCYELGILHPRSQRRAQALYALAMYLSVVGSALVMGLVAGIDAIWPGVFGRHLDWPFYVLCCLGVLTATQFNAVGFAHSRAALYVPIAISKINQTLLTTTLQIAFGLVRNIDLSLMAGRTIGLVATNLWLQRTLPVGFRLRDLPRVPWRVLLSTARLYGDYIYNVPRQLLMRGATAAPPVLLLVAYGPLEAGFFFFAQRLVERPGQLLGDSLTRVPMKQFSVRRGKGQPLLRSALFYTAVCAVPVLSGCLLLAVLANPLLPWVFGHRWEGAVNYVLIMALWAGLRISVLPTATLLTVLRRQKLSLGVDSVFAFRVLVIPLMAASGYSALWAVAGYCGLSIVYDAVTFGLGVWAARQHDRALHHPAAVI